MHPPFLAHSQTDLTEKVEECESSDAQVTLCTLRDGKKRFEYTEEEKI